MLHFVKYSVSLHHKLQLQQMEQKQTLLGMTLAEITESVAELDLPKFTAKHAYIGI